MYNLQLEWTKKHNLLYNISYTMKVKTWPFRKSLNILYIEKHVYNRDVEETLIRVQGCLFNVGVKNVAFVRLSLTRIIYVK